MKIIQQPYEIKSILYSSFGRKTSTDCNRQNQDKDQSSDKLYYGLGALAFAIAGGVLYKNSKNTNRMVKTSLINLNKILENFSKKISKIDFLGFDEEFKKIKFPNYKITNFFKSDDAKNFVKYILAAKKTGLNNQIELPKVLTFGNINLKGKEISKIFTTTIDSNFASTKYTKGHIAEFLESLDEYSSTSLKKYNEENIHTFLHFGNASELLEDLKLKENEQYKTIFDKIIAKNQENKIVYIVDDKAATHLNTDSILKLNFDEKINTADLTKDLDEVDFQLGHKLLSKTENINKELSEYIQPNGIPYFYTIRNLLMDTPCESVFLVNGKDKDIIEKAITLISTKTDNTYEKLDCKETSNLANILRQKGEKSEELYNRTGKRTFLYLDNLEQSQQINDFIATASEKYHIIPVLNSQNNEIISNLNLPKNQISKMNFWDRGQKAMSDSLELMNQRASKNDFSHVKHLDYLINTFIHPLAAERAGKQGSTEQIGNGILIYGADNLTRITADAIKNTVDANYIRIPFDKNKYSDIIDKMIDEAENAEKQFLDTRKRTVLELDGLDDLLALDRTVPENMDLINEFKSIAEDLSEKYHTTILMRTDKPLESFEKASIASNRLGMHIEVK